MRAATKIFRCIISCEDEMSLLLYLLAAPRGTMMKIDYDEK